MYESTATSNGNEPSIRTETRISHWPIGSEVALWDLRPIAVSSGNRHLYSRYVCYLNVLPYVSFWIDHAHIRLICTTIYKHAIVELKKSILCIILNSRVSASLDICASKKTCAK